MKLGPLTRVLRPSPTLAVTMRAKALQKEGRDIIGFGAGEPDFDTPDNIKAAAIRAIREGFTKYTPVGGIDELKDAVIEKLKRDNGLAYKRSEIIVSTGAKHTLFNMAQVLFGPGDEVIIPAPYWVSYPDIVQLADATPVIVDTTEEEGFKLTPATLGKALTARTRALILNSPSNPTGAAYTRKELTALAETLRGTEIIVISDDIYEKVVYDGFVFANMATVSEEMKDKTILVNGLSKSHAMTGWRIGYLCAPQPIVAMMTKLHQFGIMSAPTVSQYAVIEAMRNGDPDIERMRDEYDGRRRYLVEGLRRIGLDCFEPKGAFYVFPCIQSSGLSSEKFCERFLMEEKVAVISGSAFGAGGEGFVRCCYATSMKDIAEALTRMDNFLTNLKKKKARETEA